MTDARNLCWKCHQPQCDCYKGPQSNAPAAEIDWEARCERFEREAGEARRRAHFLERSVDAWCRRAEEVEGYLHRAKALLHRAVGNRIDDQWLAEASEFLQEKH